MLDGYLPGYKMGGPSRTIANMVEQIGDQVEFSIVTADRDKGDCVAYPDVRVDEWNPVGKAQVYYASPHSLCLRKLHRLVQEVNPDIIYLNSFFSPVSVRILAWRWLRLLPPLPVILAPRGEFSPEALQLKWWKKRPYLYLASSLNLYADVVWHVSSPFEKQALHATLGRKARVHVAPNLVGTASAFVPESAREVLEQSGTTRLVFLSRVAPMKNLLFALQLVKRIQGKVLFHIYGPISDDRYWESCQRVITEMPENIQVSYKGGVPHDRVASVLATYHLLLLPTLGENFGHVIFEALSTGCPVLISDRTPWRNLATVGVGWDLPLNDPKGWQDTLQSYVESPKSVRREMAMQARRFSAEWLASSDILRKNTELFDVVPSLDMDEGRVFTATGADGDYQMQEDI